MITTYFFYIILGFLPSTIWLLYYLHKDVHPEPKKQILQTFIWGMLIAPLAAVLEFALLWLTDPSFSLDSMASLLQVSDSTWRGLASVIIFAPIVEEYLKYKITKVKIIKDSDFDEPLDMMLYLIIGALGFAAVENLIVVLQNPMITINQALGTISVRFVGATFLHALASGMVGYFLAKSFVNGKRNSLLIPLGLAVAMIFHGAYNYLITSAEKFSSAVPLIAMLLAIMALLVTFGFSRLKKQLSICKIT